MTPEIIAVCLVGVTLASLILPTSGNPGGRMESLGARPAAAGNETSGIAYTLDGRGLTGGIKAQPTPEDG